MDIIPLLWYHCFIMVGPPTPESMPPQGVEVVAKVGMGDVGVLDYDPSNPGRQTIETSALSGCIGTVVLCQGEGGASVVVSHFPPSVDGNAENFFKLRTVLSAQAERGRGALGSVVMVAPGTDKEVFPSVMPEINRYRYVIGVDDDTTPMQVTPYMPGVSGTMSVEVVPGPGGKPALQVSFSDVAHQPHISGQ
jgi:hypothetical protein